MKKDIINSLKLVLSDRLMALAIIGLIIVCVAYCVYVGVSLRPSDLQVAVHYTAFGGTSFYRDKWYYFLSFIGFGALVAIVHSILAVKLYAQGRRQMALLFISLSILVMAIAWLVTQAVLRVAFL